MYCGLCVSGLCVLLCCFVVVISRVYVYTMPNYDIGGGCDPYLIIKSWGSEKDKYSQYGLPHSKPIRVLKRYTHINARFPQQQPVLEFVVAPELVVAGGETLIQLWDSDLVSDEAMCRIWFHPGMIQNDRLLLSKREIDDAWNSNNFSAGFRIELVFVPCK